MEIENKHLPVLVFNPSSKLLHIYIYIYIYLYLIEILLKLNLSVYVCETPS